MWPSFRADKIGQLQLDGSVCIALRATLRHQTSGAWRIHTALHPVSMRYQPIA